MSEKSDIRVIVSIGIAVFAVLVAIFIYRNVVVFGIGGDLDVDQGTLFVHASENRVGIKVKTPSYSLDVVGDVNSTTKFRELGFILIPVGTIVMWSGAMAPNGWVLCDGGSYPRLDGSGTISTPDLRGRFVIGQGQGTGLTNRVLDSVGGAETHTLSVSELPSHTHTGTTDSSGAHVHSITDPGHTHTITDPGHTHTQTTINDDFNSSGDGSNAPGFADDSAGTRTWTNINSSTTGISVNSNSTGITVDSNGSHTHTFTSDSTGGGAAHNNMPPFYVLAYIMKV